MYGPQGLAILMCFCSVCQCDISIKASGQYDIERQQLKHKARFAVTKWSNITNFVTDSTDYSVINTEVLFTNAFVIHNIPILFSDHISQLFPRMFPDSQIASKYGCGQKKSAAIAHTLAS